MNIELYIDGKKKTFTTPFVPMLAKRKYYEIMAKAEEYDGEPSIEQQLEEETELVSILADIVFGGQFTVEEVFQGASQEYVYEKLREAVFGKKTRDEQGNEQGK